jgi:transposase-like protein
MTREADHATLVRALAAPRVTVAAIADQFGVTGRTVYRWLAGRHRIPKAVITILNMEQTDA